MSCDTAGGLLIYYYINFGIKLIMIMAPIILLVLGTIDFMGAVTAGDEKGMKKSIQTFLKRMLICVIILILPTIISLIMSFSPKESTLFNCLDKATKENVKKLEQEQEEKDKATKEQTIPKEEEIKLLNITSGVFERSDYDSEMRYVEVIPEDATTNLPLIIYLHGIWSYNSFSKSNGAKNYPITEYVKSGEAYSSGKFILIVPRIVLYEADSSGSVSWKTKQGKEQTAKLKGLIDFIVNKYKINNRKIIITGFSLGGDGTWNMVESYPDLFSSAVVVSGCAGKNPIVSNYVNTPITAYHGTGGVEYTDYKGCINSISNKIQNAGGNVRVIVKKGYGHGQMQSVYSENNGAIFNWMLEQ